ncbi:MAG: hypothetical protein IPF92_17125 [Myxococcales bacterium]|nr:hypothetical protein [Myxococcales bacterium]
MDLDIVGVEIGEAALAVARLLDCADCKSATAFFSASLVAWRAPTRVQDWSLTGPHAGGLRGALARGNLAHREANGHLARVDLFGRVRLARGELAALLVGLGLVGLAATRAEAEVRAVDLPFRFDCVAIAKAPRLYA